MACAHCGQFIHDGELCDNCAKPEALAAWEEDHARPAPEEAADSEGEFICAVCGRACKSEIGLRSHVKTHA